MFLKYLLIILFIFPIVVFSQSIKKLDDLKTELNIAIHNNDFQKAEHLKKEIKQAEEINSKIKSLEEDKKIAIFLEKYEDVITINQKINNLKNGVNSNTETHQKNQQTLLQPTIQQAVNLNSIQPLMIDKPLSDYKYNQKIIKSYAAGFTNYSETYTSTESVYNYYTGQYETKYNTETIDYFLFSINTSSHRWWLNKYFVAGPWYEAIIGDDYFTFNGGIQLSFLADFNSILLPYSTIGTGIGLEYFEDIVIPLNHKLGTYLFTNKNRSFGFLFELNYYFTNPSPLYRFGIVYSKVK